MLKSIVCEELKNLLRALFTQVIHNKMYEHCLLMEFTTN